MTEGAKELKLHAQRRQSFLSETLQPTAATLRNQYVHGLTIYSVAAGWADLLLFGFIGVLLFVMPALQGLSPAVLTACALVSLYLMTPLAVVMNLLPTFGLARAALHKIQAPGLSLVAPEDAQPAPQMPPAGWRLLELRNVTHAYHVEREERGFTLGPINLAFRPGELIFLVGGNGSGKTTLAKLLAGLYVPESGAIALDGQPVTDATRERYRQLFSMVFADFYLFEQLNGLGSPELEARGQKYLELLQLDHKVRITDRRLSTTALSQGQRKRLALLTAYLEDRPFYWLAPARRARSGHARCRYPRGSAILRRRRECLHQLAQSLGPGVRAFEAARCELHARALDDRRHAHLVEGDVLAAGGEPEHRAARGRDRSESRHGGRPGDRPAQTLPLEFARHHPG